MSAKEKKSSGDQWFLRTGPDVVFGPVEKQGLLLWAQQARILPGHEVSTDRKNWKSAVSVEFLDMCWFVDDDDGDLKGPLNRQAAETLVKNGKFSAKARIVSASEVSPENEKMKFLTKKMSSQRKNPRSLRQRRLPKVEINRQRVLSAPRKVHLDLPLNQQCLPKNAPNRFPRNRVIMDERPSCLIKSMKAMH